MVIHSEDLIKRWRKMPFIEQMANIGSEVYRAMRWQGKDKKLFTGAVDRALELFSLTISAVVETMADRSDSRWRKMARLRELTRVREVFCDAILGGKEYNSSLADLERYFFHFAVATRLKK